MGAKIFSAVTGVLSGPAIVYASSAMTYCHCLVNHCHTAVPQWPEPMPRMEAIDRASEREPFDKATTERLARTSLVCGPNSSKLDSDS